MTMMMTVTGPARTVTQLPELFLLKIKCTSVMEFKSQSNQQWIYVSRPEGRVSADNYRLDTCAIEDDLSQNEVLVEMQYISVDPYMRIEQAATDTFSPSYPLGTLQMGTTVGVIRKSANEKFNVGDNVVGYLGWRRFARCHGNDVKPISMVGDVPLTAYMGVLGMPGRTAWFGLMDAGKPRPGEVLVVSAAAGAVGSLVVQFGKKAGCTVVGIQGGAEKCAFVKNELKADYVVDYKKFNSPALLGAEISRQVARPVDVYFDNVGGWITDTIIPMINLRARIIICGQISQYNGGLDAPSMEPRFLQHMLYKRATIQGILAR